MRQYESSFGQEVAEAASSFMGHRAINHQRYSYCRQGPSLRECVEVGINDDEFDCSGLCVRAIADVLGVKANTVDLKHRHARQMGLLVDRTRRLHAQVGDIALFGKVDYLNGTRQFMATHAGIVVKPEMNGEQPRMVHSNVAHWSRVTNGNIGAGEDEKISFVGYIDSRHYAEVAFNT